MPTLCGRDLAQSPRKPALLGIRTTQIHWGLSVPNHEPDVGICELVEQQQGRGSRGRGDAADEGARVRAAWAAGVEKEAAETELCPRGSMECFQVSQVRLGYRSLEARGTGDRTADLSQLTLHPAAIIGKQAPGEKKSKIIYHPS